MRQVRFVDDESWSAAVEVGSGIRMLATGGDPPYRFEHPCKVVPGADTGDESFQVVCAPLLSAGGQVVVSEDPLTITPSLLCPDCGTHGWVQNGRWWPA